MDLLTSNIRQVLDYAFFCVIEFTPHAAVPAARLFGLPGNAAAFPGDPKVLELVVGVTSGEGPFSSETLSARGCAIACRLLLLRTSQSFLASGDIGGVFTRWASFGSS